MDYRSLRAFVVLADTLNYRKASEVCDLTTSSLSRIIQRMEDELGCMLFRRNHRQVVLTNEGGVFYEFASKSLAQWGDVQRMLTSEYPSDLTGNVRIICSSTFAGEELLTDILQKFMNKYGNVIPHVSSSDVLNCMNKIYKGHADFSVCTMYDRPKNIDYFKKIIAVSELVYVYHGAWQEPKSMKEIEDYPLGLAEGETMKVKVGRAFKKNKLDPRIIATFDSVNASMLAISSGICNGILPRIIVEKYLDTRNIKIAEKINLEEEVEYCIYGRIGGYLSAASQAFWNVVLELDFPKHKFDLMPK